MISCRQSDLFKRLKEINIVNITGYDNYTPEVIAKLEEMFNAGQIDSRPVKDDYENITWIDRNKDENRSNNLPVREWKDGDVQYLVDGKFSRKNGPAQIIATRKSIFWNVASGYLAANEDDKNFSLNREKCSKEEYEEFIRKNFPEAKETSYKYWSVKK